MRSRWSVAILWAVSMVTIVLLTPCCVPVTPAPTPVPFASSVPPCAAATPLPHQADVCDGRFTAEALACVKCQVPAGCLLPGVVVYCTPSCSDHACSAVAAGKHKR